METTKLNTILANSTTLCRDLTNIDIVIIASAMVKVWKESNTNIHNPPSLPNTPNSIPSVGLETRKNQYIKIFINIISGIKGVSDFDNMFNLITGLTDNFNYFTAGTIEEICLSNIGDFNNLIVNMLSSISNIKISSFNKNLYDNTYIFFKNYFDNDDQEKMLNTNNYINFLNDNLKKNILSKTELASVFVGLTTFVKLAGNNVNINKEKIIENLSTGYNISNSHILQFFNKIFFKICNNQNVNVENEVINYKLVFEVINWCI